MSTWKVVRDLTETSSLIGAPIEVIKDLISKMDASDWEDLKNSLRKETEKNIQTRKSLELLIRVADVAIEKGFDALI